MMFQTFMILLHAGELSVSHVNITMHALIYRKYLQVIWQEFQYKYEREQWRLDNKN